MQNVAMRRVMFAAAQCMLVVVGVIVTVALFPAAGMVTFGMLWQGQVPPVWAWASTLMFLVLYAWFRSRRSQPCPTCGKKWALEPADVARGEQCDHCDERAREDA
jgi:hypothetical protein